MVCEQHDGLVSNIVEIKNDIRYIKELMLGNGKLGLTGRIQKLEFSLNSYSSFISRVLNIVQGVLIAVLIYLMIGK